MEESSLRRIEKFKEALGKLKEMSKNSEEEFRNHSKLVDALE